MKRAESIQERQASVEGILIAKIYFFFKINHYYISFESIPVKITFWQWKTYEYKVWIANFYFYADMNDPVWKAHKKHVFILSEAGKPIYTR